MTVSTIPRVLDPFRVYTTVEHADMLNWICEHCHQHCGGRGGPESNHCLVPDRKRYGSQVDEAINKELVCHICHQEEEVHTFVHRVAFKRKQEDRYGVKRVDGWLRSIPMVSDGIVEA